MKSNELYMNKNKNKNKFLAKYIYTDENLDKPTQMKNSITKYSNEINTEEIFDLDSLNLVQLVQNLKKSIDKKPSRFLFFRRRENTKIALETEKVQLLINNISSLRFLGREMMEMKADAILTTHLLNFLVANKRQEFEQAFELNIEKHYTAIELEKNTRIRDNQLLTDKYLEQEKQKAEIEFLNAKTEEQKQNAEFMKIAIDDFKNLPSPYKVYMFSQYINRHKNSAIDNSPQDFDLDEFFKEYMKNKYKADLEQVNAETLEIQSKSEFEKWKNDRKMGKI